VTLRDLLTAAAAALSDLTSSPTRDGEVTWAKGGDVFAVLGSDGASAEFALDRAVAAAAVRTPDTAPSPRGPGWVQFRPETLDSHGEDRASAWFASAYRHAAGRDVSRT
jgi:hypothetical protein